MYRAITCLTLLIVLSTTKVFTQFQEYTSQMGQTVNNPILEDGNGASFADFNMDGWDDISVVRNDLDPLFFINNGGTFSLFDLNITNSPAVDQRAVLWADYDNDGDRDLLITQKYHPVKLYRNDGDIQNMTDVAIEIGIAAQNVWNSGASWVDFDRDGWLDLYICKFYFPGGIPDYQFNNHLYRNLGDGTFQDVTSSAGVGNGITTSFQSIFFDYDNDLWPDLYIINDRVQVPNALYHNNGDGTFTNWSSQSGTNLYIDAMCCNVADYDHDGDLDLFITDTGPDRLLKNNGNGTFTNTAPSAGVNSGEHGWGSAWLDYQNDTWQDLFVANQATEPNNTLLQNNFYLNEGDATFIHYESEVGLLNDIDASFSVIKADFDHDGWEDFFTHNADESISSLWKNQTWQNSSNNWIQVNLLGTASNNDAVGSWIEIHLPNDVLVDYSTCGENYLSQNSFTKHFGLGSFEQADSVVIKWPSGLVESYYNVPANQLVHYVEGTTLSVNLNVSGQQLSCFGDSILLTVSGYTNTLWSNGIVADSLYADTSGTYFAYVTTPEGIELITDTLQITFNEQLLMESATTDVLCFGEMNGTVEFIPSGGTPPYEIFLPIFNQNSLLAGSYQVFYTDALGCTDSSLFSIEEPDLLQASWLDEALIDPDGCGMYHAGEASPIGGVPPYGFNWVFDGPGLDVPLVFETSTYDCVPNEEIYFSLLIADSNGCEILIQDTLEIFMSITEANPHGIVLFPVPTENILNIQGIGIQELSLYSSCGKLVHLQTVQSENNPQAISMAEFAQGSYILKAKTSSGTYFFRIVHL
jgi:hypothetical protein